MKKYDHKKIDKHWQEVWQKEKIYFAEDNSNKPKKYVLIEFPYPSGEGLHMGHLRPYVAGDVYSRYQRMKGFETMYPIGWDAFGLPAENYAIKMGIHPSIVVEKNIKNAKRQIMNWGIGFDWEREINTTDPDYYKWTQWIFLQFFKAGLAYEATGIINWCPSCKTGLANEEVVNGECERCGTKAEKKELRQWYLKITAYADKLLKGLENLDWPEQIKIQQQNWIGKSEGALLQFSISNFQFPISVFTTRPDTLFGATYLVLSPEHELIENLKLKIGNYDEVERYVEEAKNKTEIQRTSNDKEKTGVELKGVIAINPANQKEIPIWVADYVLSGYGTGAIMAVPTHDERDAAFAKKFNLPFSNAPLVDSNEIVRKVGGKLTTQYKLRDWVFSRQRYWGEPIPIIHCSSCGNVAVPEKDLPVTLPKVKKYEPTGTGESPLAVIDEWVNVKCPECGGPAKRETNTMPQWAGSSWYYLRYSDPNNKKVFASDELMKHWQPVDIYFGGWEHTTLHLLYSRFWHLFLYDQKLVPTPEPYTKRIHHGLILAADGEKMSKSRGNVVNPDDIVKESGADTLRTFELFLGPHEHSISWSNDGIVGIKRFLDRVWKLSEPFMSEYNPATANTGLDKLVHKTIQKVGNDVENYKFNTAVSQLMILSNEFTKTAPSREQFEIFLQLLAPFAPHMAEEIWRNTLSHKESIHISNWPEFDPVLIVDDTVDFVFQINGKVRAVLPLPKDSDQKTVEKIARENDSINKYLSEKTVKTAIFVPGKLINFVI